MQFILDAEIKFTADNLEDACCKLVDHFKTVAGFKVLPELDFTGRINLKPGPGENEYSTEK